MPIYTFKCPQCNNQFSDFFSMSDYNGIEVKCPQCGKVGLKRVTNGAPSFKVEGGTIKGHTVTKSMESEADSSDSSDSSSCSSCCSDGACSP